METTVPFFQKFAGFKPDPSARVSDEFSRLAKHRQWKPGSKTWRKRWKECIYSEFRRLYGDDDSRLQSWQRLCLDLGFEALPSITQCKKRLSKVYVNIVDLINCRVAGGKPELFSSVSALRRYTNESGRFFPKKLAKEEGFIKILLKHIS